MSIFKSFNVLFASLAVALVAVTPAAAQQAALSPDAVTTSVSTSAVEAGPTVRNTTVGVRAIQPLGAPELAPMKFGPTNRNVAWMIVGGAGLLVGAVIGGDPGTIVMVGGGVIGLIGLFRYLN